MKFAKNMTTKTSKYHNGKLKLEGRGYLLVGDERKCKNESIRAQIKAWGYWKRGLP